MKKLKSILVLLLIILISSQVFAQLPYSFNYFNEKYIPLNQRGEVQVIAGDSSTWANLQQLVPLGFNFNFHYGEADSMVVFDTGSNIFQRLDSGKRLSLSFNVLWGLFFFQEQSHNFGADTSISKVWYRTEGEPGNKIFQIEYFNVKTSRSTEADSIYFQIWLYEKDNSIEYRFGPGKIKTPDSTLFKNYKNGFTMEILFGGSKNGFVSKRARLYGSAKNPNLILYSYPNKDVIDSLPPNGMVYRFYKLPSGINKLNYSDEVHVFPNPAVEILQVNKDFNKFFIYNTIGVLVNSEKSNSTRQIDINALKSGIYFLKLESDKGVFCTKFIKE